MAIKGRNKGRGKTKAPALNFSQGPKEASRRQGFKSTKIPDRFMSGSRMGVGVRPTPYSLSAGTGVGIRVGERNRFGKKP